MKTIVIIISSLFFLSQGNQIPETIISHQDSSEGIEFFAGDLDMAVEKAKNENKMIFMDISTSWCGYCKKLKAYTYTDEEVGNFFNKHFINLSFDAEKGKGIEIRKKYAANSFPTLVFLDKEGNLIYKTMGYRNAQNFLKLARKVVSG
jgi:thioredoxin-related protein